jgi:predicted small secreted protein
VHVRIYKPITEKVGVFMRKTYILKFISLVLVAMIMTSCVNTYKRGVDYSDFPDRDIPIYDDAVVYYFESDDEESELSYGTTDDIDDIVEFYQDEFDDSDYIITKEKEDKDEYEIEGYIGNTHFEIEAEEARRDEEKYFDYVVTISTEPFEEEKSEYDETDNDIDNTSSLNLTDEQEMIKDDAGDDTDMPVSEISYRQYYHNGHDYFAVAFSTYYKSAIAYIGGQYIDAEIMNNSSIYEGMNDIQISMHLGAIPNERLTDIEIELIDESGNTADTLVLKNLFLVSNDCDLADVDRANEVEHLVMRENSIASWKALENYDNLKSLVAQYCSFIDDLEDIPSLPTLEYINIECYKIKADISVFNGMKNLKVLRYSEPQATSLNNHNTLYGQIDSLSNLKNLEIISISDCGALSGDIGSFSSLTNLKGISFSFCQNISGDIGELSNLSELRTFFLFWAFNIKGDIGVFKDMDNMESLVLNNCPEIYGDSSSFEDYSYLNIEECPRIS